MLHATFMVWMCEVIVGIWVAAFSLVYLYIVHVICGNTIAILYLYTYS